MGKQYELHVCLVMPLYDMDLFTYFNQGIPARDGSPERDQEILTLESERMEVILQVVRALQVFHKTLGRVHNDFKLDNVFYRGGRVYIGDIATAVKKDED